MEVKILYVIILLSSSLLFSNVICGPNHHHNNHNDFPWQNILSSLGIVVENQTGVISITELTGDPSVNSKEHYTSETPVEILKSETKEGIETPVVRQNGLTINNDQVISSDVRHEDFVHSTGFKIAIPIVSILLFILIWWCICTLFCACRKREPKPGVVLQSNQAPVAPQIILEQPIIHQQAPPMYDTQHRVVHPPPQGHAQWSQPPQDPPQWAPHPMGEQQQYSPHGGYDNDGFNPATAQPPYNTGKY